MPYAHKNIRLESPHYLGQTSYFVTICCQHRQPVFADASLATWLVEELRKYSTAFGFAVHAYCVMPDHLHALVYGLAEDSELLKFLKILKQVTGYEYQQQFGGVLWQKKFHDHILRQGEPCNAVAGYIWMNPVRAGLCTDPRDYPHSGSFTMDWKKIMRPLESWVPTWKKSTSSPA